MREHRIRRTKTVCTYCGVGCSFDVWTKDRHILKVAPEHGPANGISTCIKGKVRLGFRQQRRSPDHAADSRGRQVSPGQLGRSARAWSPADCREIKAKSGPDAIAFISSSKCTNEESYLMQKLARAVIGTNNIDNCSRYCQAPATMGLFRTVGYGGDSGSITRYREGRSRAHHRQQHRGEPSGAGHARQERSQTARAEADRLRPARA